MNRNELAKKYATYVEEYITKNWSKNNHDYFQNNVKQDTPEIVDTLFKSIPDYLITLIDAFPKKDSYDNELTKKLVRQLERFSVQNNSNLKNFISLDDNEKKELSDNFYTVEILGALSSILNTNEIDSYSEGEHKQPCNRYKKIESLKKQHVECYTDKLSGTAAAAIIHLNAPIVNALTTHNADLDTIDARHKKIMAFSNIIFADPTLARAFNNEISHFHPHGMDDNCPPIFKNLIKSIDTIDWDNVPSPDSPIFQSFADHITSHMQQHCKKTGIIRRKTKVEGHDFDATEAVKSFDKVQATQSFAEEKANSIYRQAVREKYVTPGKTQHRLNGWIEETLIRFNFKKQKTVKFLVDQDEKKSLLGVLEEKLNAQLAKNKCTSEQLDKTAEKLENTLKQNISTERFSKTGATIGHASFTSRLKHICGKYSKELKFPDKNDLDGIFK